MTSSLEAIGLVARRLIQFEARFVEAPLERRHLMAEYFMQMGRVVSSIHFELQKDRVPHEGARQMALLASQLLTMIEPEAGSLEAERIHALFILGCDTERLCRDYQASEQKSPNDEIMEKSFILLQALANGLVGANSSETTPSSENSFPTAPL